MSNRFADLGINIEIQESLSALQISVPTDIQEKVIPVILSQTEDVVALAKTGTGKTAAFGLPLLQLIDTTNDAIQAIVLAPTRELSQQIHQNLASFAANNPEISIAVI
ncbi:DEAD/DEAH box helicase, partial [Polaribacter sp.]|nr:DEAD/DEAH box helicase [Polaribacter sp.]